MSLDANDVVRLLKQLLPELIVLVLVVGVALRLAVKPTIDAILRLREGVRDQNQIQQRIARLEEEVTRLQAGDSRVAPALDDGSWSKGPVRRE